MRFRLVHDGRLGELAPITAITSTGSNKGPLRRS